MSERTCPDCGFSGPEDFFRRDRLQCRACHSAHNARNTYHARQKAQEAHGRHCHSCRTKHPLSAFSVEKQGPYGPIYQACCDESRKPRPKAPPKPMGRPPKPKAPSAVAFTLPPSSAPSKPPSARPKRNREDRRRFEPATAQDRRREPALDLEEWRGRLGIMLDGIFAGDPALAARVEAILEEKTARETRKAA